MRAHRDWTEDLGLAIALLSPRHRLRMNVRVMFPLLACLITQSGIAVASEVPPVDTRDALSAALDLNAQARGGKARLESLQALRLQVHITEPGFDVSGIYVATREGYVRIDVYAEEVRVFSEALGPMGGWQWRAGSEDTQPLSQAGEAALRRGLVSNLYALHAWPDQGYTLTLADDTDRTQVTVEAIAADGFVKRLLIDPDTHLVTRVWETSALHPDIDGRETAQYTQVLKWKSVDGILLPTLTEKVDAQSGDTIQRAEVVSLELHVSGKAEPDWANPDYFSAPSNP